MAAPLKSKWAYPASVAVLLLANLLFYGSGLGRRKAEPASSLPELPLNVNGWEGRELAIAERGLKMLGTPNVIFRLYRKGERTVELYLLESSINRSAFHPPEYCYVGGRTELIERGSAELAWNGRRVSANRFVFEGPRGRSLVYYWYTFGRRSMSGYHRQQLLIVAHNLLGDPQPAFLIRLSIAAVPEDGEGDSTIEEFAREVMPAILAHL